ncbi:hypothetical protein Bca52824_096623 [Brassica carinata]|uniref:Cystatin domain-containing protein n=1 Tax=Brassica carinata TaxID=52824 RepID=A0A8X7NXU5_BRACI|nr:hypothetical protein Bca52824_096623 [Brassica carinata]
MLSTSWNRSPSSCGGGEEKQGFDIDFDYYRCVFKYHRAYLDDAVFGDVSETTGDLISQERLSQKSLEDHNVNEKREFEFVRVVKSNFHFSAGLMFLITFEVIDPYDGNIKPFQARVRYLNDTFTEYIFCRPKPNIGGLDLNPLIDLQIGVGSFISYKHSE